MPKIERQIRNIVIVLVTSLAVAVGAFRLQPAGTVEEVPYDYFLWGAFIFALIVLQDAWKLRYGAGHDAPRPSHPEVRALEVVLAGILVVYSIAGLLNWRLIKRFPDLEIFPEGTFRGNAIREASETAILLYVVAVLLLFVEGLGARPRAPGSRRIGGCLYLLLLLGIAGLLAGLLRYLLGYPDLLSNGAIGLVLSLALLLLVGEAIRSRRAGGRDRPTSTPGRPSERSE